jgi:hypothetical protein
MYAELVADVVADLLEGAAGGVHERHERMPALVQTDRLERDRLATEERADGGSGPGGECAVADVRRRERCRRRAAEYEVVAAAASPGDMLEQDSPQDARDRNTPDTLLRLRGDLPLNLVPSVPDVDLRQAVAEVRAQRGRLLSVFSRSCLSSANRLHARRIE